MSAKKPEIHLHKGDLPAGIDFGDAVAVDSEAMGLKNGRDRLCVVQLSAGDGVCHLVQFISGEYDAPNLKAVMVDPNVVKMFHYARFDVAIMKHYLGVTCQPVYCTKIASRLARTYTDRHGLKDVCRELVGVERVSFEPLRVGRESCGSLLLGDQRRESWPREGDAFQVALAFRLYLNSILK